MKKIKVAHFVNNLQLGGVLSVINNCYSVIDKSKYEFHIIFIDNATPESLEIAKNNNYILHRVISRKKNIVKNIYQNKVIIKKEGFDIVHSHLTETGFIPLFWAKKYKIKHRIAHSHNFDVREKSKIKKIIIKLCKFLTNKFCTTRIACGKEAGNYLFGNYPFQIMNNAINIPDYMFSEIKRMQIRSKYNIGQNTIVLGNIGRLTYQKNQSFLLEIIYKIIKLDPNYKVVLFIIGDGEDIENLKSRAKELKIQDKVYFLGACMNAKDYYNAFDIFLLPSLWEGLPVVGIEAQISGLPCFLSSNITDEVVINPTTKKIDLFLDEWVSKIIDFKIVNDRTKNIDLLLEKYDIKKQSSFINELYKID